jgi:arachidonate 15-lipoxygenase
MTIPSRVSLPQNDRSLAARHRKLTELREKFRFDLSVVPNVPIAATVPEEAKPGPGWSLKIVATAYKLRRNWEKIMAAHRYVFEEALPHKQVGDIAAMLIQKDLLGLLAYSDPDLGVALSDKRPRSFSQYYELFKHFPAPGTPDELFDDAAFADYFVAGLNPLMIRVMTEIPAKLGLDEASFRAHPAFAADDLEQALLDGRLFLVDYHQLTALEPGRHPDQPKYTYAPIVVLAIPPGGKDLEVIGVQCGQDKARYPLVTARTGPWDWLVAKTIVRTADINYHEVASHLGLTHLVIDPIVVATYRQLAGNHPLHKLLVPHFEGTLPINALAVRRLINKGGKVEELLSPQIESAYKVLAAIRNDFHFRESFLPRQVQKRGVGFDSAVASYPYRDDGILIWNAIDRWVRDYVDLYYETDADVAEDDELAQWTAEIVSPEAGRIRGFAPDDAIVTKQVLAETLTMIIFTASAQHAAVNFPQGKAAAVPYQPLAGYAPAPTTTGLTEQDALDFLPPLDRAIKQTHTLTLLGETYYTQLGWYAPFAFDDPRVVPGLLRFQERLRGIESEIDRRNTTRRAPYAYLKPSLIPQSINI